jgi:hypothetical protein
LIVQAFGSIGRAAKEAIPALRESLSRGESNQVLKNKAASLGPAVIKALEQINK